MIVALETTPGRIMAPKNPFQRYKYNSKPNPCALCLLEIGDMGRQAHKYLNSCEPGIL